MLTVILTGAAACTRSADVAPADLVLQDGKIVTMDPSYPEARAIAVRGGKIIAVGTLDDVASMRGPKTRTIDLAGRLAVPGFIESHAHLMGIGHAKMRLDLKNTKNWSEVVARVAGAVAGAGPGEWIVGRGWHQEKWDAVPAVTVDGFPVHDGLSEVSPDHPVLLTHASGHATFVNARAMEAAGITHQTPDPPGGEILRDAKGRATGLLSETASKLVWAAYTKAMAQRTPEQVEKDEARALDLAIEEVVSKGITTFHDAGASFDTVDRYKRYADERRLRVRLWVMLGEDNEALAERINEYKMVGYGDDFLTVRAIKRSIDGALGSRGAWLLDEYADLPGSTGLNTTTIPDLEETARIALQHEFQLCVHAIGDRGNRETIDLYGRILRTHQNPTGRRWRIEHAQHLHPDDIPRFSRLGVIAAMQGVHATSDAPFVEPRLGTRRAREGAYVWRALLDTKAIIANGTDAPVEDVDPVACFYSSVTRKPANGPPFHPEQRMTRTEALRSYTAAAAYAAFEEDVKGTLTPGKLADVVVLSKDILTVPDDEIRSARVFYTIVGGSIVYEAAPVRSRP